MIKNIDFKDYYEKIIEMNTLVSNDLKDENLIPLYIKLTKEELGEIAIDSFKEHNNKEFLDGLIDSLVVGYYLFLLQDNKNIGTYKFNLSNNTLSDKEMADFIVQFRSHIKNHNIKENIENILVMLEMVANTLNSEIDLDAAFKEVMRSNFTKFPIVGTVDVKKEIAFIEQKYNQTGFYTKEVKDNQGNIRHVFYNASGKFVKPSVFEEPELKVLLPNGFDIIQRLKLYI